MVWSSLARTSNVLENAIAILFRIQIPKYLTSCSMEVLRFLSVPGHTPSSIYAAIIEPLRVETCDVLEHLHFPRELQRLSSLICSDFVSIIPEPQSNIAIPVEHIVMKCVDISTVCFSGLTILVNEHEALK